jgi:hypothetical protein
MSTRPVISLLFIIAALYDGVLGIGFLFAGPTLFEWFSVTPPNHWGYVQFPAVLLVIFALMFAAVAMDPVRNRNLIPYGILLKLAYCGVVCFHWFTADIPDMWKPFAVVDFLFLLTFCWAYVIIRKPVTQENGQQGA